MNIRCVSAALVVFGLLPATAAVASPAPAITQVTVTCGQIITRDTKVANDLIDCPRHGLVIGAANITLDLNGHTIDGNGVIFEPCPVDEPCNAGIANSGIRDGRPINGRGFEGVTIANGTVREFAEGGIYITGTRNAVVHSIDTSTSVYESAGVHLRGCTLCAIHDVSASAVSVGIVVEGSHNVRVENNTIHDNDLAGGVIVALSGAVRITGNTIYSNRGSAGIVLVAGSDNNVVQNNSLFGNAAGIGLEDGCDENIVSGNSIHDNTFVGVYVANASRNVIERNEVARNGDGSEGGIHVLAPDGPSVGNLIARNTVSANVGDGVLVDSGPTRTIVEGNHANGNSDDGFDIQSATTKMVANTATGNSDLGFETVPGVTGGGNKASGNGNPLQCTNVLCR